MNTVAKGALIVLCAIALSATAADAQRGGWKDDGPRRDHQERIAEFLELTDKQIDEIKELREEQRSQMADLRKEMMRVKNDIRGEMLEDDPDVSALKKLLAKKGEIRTEMDIARLEHRLAMREILTEEQLDKLMMHRGRGGRGGPGRHGRGFGRGGMGGRGMGPGGGAGFDGPGGDGPMMGMGFEGEGPGDDCLGLGPGPCMLCEE